MDGYKHYIKTRVVGADTLVVDGYVDWQTDKYDPIDTQLSGTYPRQFQYPIFNSQRQYKYKLVNGQMVERTQVELDAEINTVSKRRQDVLDKWDPQIDAQRDTLRKLQDEDKPAAAITKAKTNLHNLVASKNAELTGVV